MKTIKSSSIKKKAYAPNEYSLKSWISKGQYVRFGDPSAKNGLSPKIIEQIKADKQALNNLGYNIGQISWNQNSTTITAQINKI